jgi:ribosomal protein L37AE/L43A
MSEYLSDQTHDVEKSAAAAADVVYCPNCGRKLLTQTSILCNWCGAKIDDPAYLERAAETRHQHDESERAAVETMVQEEARYGVLGRLKRRAKLQPGALPPPDPADPNMPRL